MFKTVLETILQPAITRGGTLISGMLIGYGVTAQHADAISIGIVSAVLVGIDFALSFFSRKNLARQAKTEGVNLAVRQLHREGVDVRSPINGE